MMNDWVHQNLLRGAIKDQGVSNNGDVKLHFDALVISKNAQNSFYQPEILITTMSTNVMSNTFL